MKNCSLGIALFIIVLFAKKRELIEHLDICNLSNKFTLLCSEKKIDCYFQTPMEMKITQCRDLFK